MQAIMKDLGPANEALLTNVPHLQKQWQNDDLLEDDEIADPKPLSNKI